MPKYRVYGVVIGTKYIGEIEADNPEHAKELAPDHDKAYVSLCHQCAGECDDANIDYFEVEEVVDGTEGKR